jgi:hypothetical protein
MAKGDSKLNEIAQDISALAEPVESLRKLIPKQMSIP